MASEAVTEAIDNLRQALIDDGMDEGTADAFLHAATPNEVNLVGNFADLNRMGAGGSPLASEEAVDYSAMTKTELVAEAEAAGIDATGATKAEIIAALEGGG